MPSLSSSWLIADPSDARVAMWQSALRDYGAPAARIVDYRELLTHPSAALADVRAGAVVRIESPGRAPDILAALLRRGGACQPPPAAGRLVDAGVWYRGFRSVLSGIRNKLRPRDVHFTSDPDDIACLFDKSRCHSVLHARKVRVARRLESVSSYDTLRHRMREASASRVFVKPRYGSSASGVVALETSFERAQAWTTVEVVRGADGIELYNTRRIRRVRDESEIAAIVDALGEQGVHVERWVPKAGLDGRRFDLRVLTVAGEPACTVVRSSRSPLTNLHLSNRRSDASSVRAHLAPGVWKEVVGTCREVARAFPNTLQLGLDVAVTAGFRGHVVLEVNAFGDWLRGHRTHDLQVRALVERSA